MRIEGLRDRMASEWDRRALDRPQYQTAAYDARSEDTYWLSGTRDVELILALLRRGDFRDSSVVEIGCGLGRICRPLSPHVKRVVGVDISMEMLRLSSGETAPNLNYIRGDGVGLGFLKPSSVDL